MKKARNREELQEILLRGGMSPEEVREVVDDPVSTIMDALSEVEPNAFIEAASSYLYQEAGVSMPTLIFNALTIKKQAYPLSDSRHRPLQIMLPAEAAQVSYKSLKLHQLFQFTNMDESVLQRELEPGAYVIVGKPASGKSALGKAAMLSLIREGFHVAKVNIMEPLPQAERAAGVKSATLDNEIESALNTILCCNADVLYVDSLRFLAAISRYPARTGGIPGGLELYATVFDEAAARVGKRLFLVITTGDAKELTTETYITLMQGAVQGVISPSTLTVEDVGIMTGRGDITLRGADRTRMPFTVELDQPVTMAVSKEAVERVKGRSSTKEHTLSKLTERI